MKCAREAAVDGRGGGTGAAPALMSVMARACGHSYLNEFNTKDLTTWKKEMAELSGIK